MSNDNDRRAEIEARLAAATPWPWSGIAATLIRGRDKRVVADVRNSCDPDANLIREAPADLRWCLDRIAALETENAELRAYRSEINVGYAECIADREVLRDENYALRHELAELRASVEGAREAYKAYRDVKDTYHEWRMHGDGLWAEDGERWSRASDLSLAANAVIDAAAKLAEGGDQ